MIRFSMISLRFFSRCINLAAKQLQLLLDALHFQVPHLLPDLEMLADDLDEFVFDLGLFVLACSAIVFGHLTGRTLQLTIGLHGLEQFWIPASHHFKILAACAARNRSEDLAGGREAAADRPRDGPVADDSCGAAVPSIGGRGSRRSARGWPGRRSSCARGGGGSPRFGPPRMSGGPGGPSCIAARWLRPTVHRGGPGSRPPGTGALSQAVSRSRGGGPPCDMAVRLLSPTSKTPVDNMRENFNQDIDSTPFHKRTGRDFAITRAPSGTMLAWSAWSA